MAKTTIQVEKRLVPNTPPYGGWVVSAEIDANTGYATIENGVFGPVTLAPEEYRIIDVFVPPPAPASKLEFYDNQPLIRAIEVRLFMLQRERVAEAQTRYETMGGDGRPYVLAALDKEKYDLLDVLNQIKPGPSNQKSASGNLHPKDDEPVPRLSTRESYND